MTLYTELLRLALDDGPVSNPRETSVEELLVNLRARATRLQHPKTGGDATDQGAVEWTADLIAHDVLLVHLCERLGIDHALTDNRTAPVERDRLLAELGARVGQGMGPFPR